VTSATTNSWTCSEVTSRAGDFVGRASFMPKDGTRIEILGWATVLTPEELWTQTAA
jgi:hypothetical protein